MAEGGQPRVNLGFLGIVEHPQHGLIGGYLILNSLGRPLEFHCSTPLRPNRAQQILFGPTLRPYLFGEQIGQTLVSKCSIVPALICTDHADSLALRDFITIPMALVAANANDPAGAISSGCLDLSNCIARVARQHAGDEQQIVGIAAGLGQNFDFLEPFGRIREAIQEALATWNVEPSARCA